MRINVIALQLGFVNFECVPFGEIPGLDISSAINYHFRLIRVEGTVLAVDKKNWTPPPQHLFTNLAYNVSQIESSFGFTDSPRVVFFTRFLITRDYFVILIYDDIYGFSKNSTTTMGTSRMEEDSDCSCFLLRHIWDLRALEIPVTILHNEQLINIQSPFVVYPFGSSYVYQVCRNYIFRSRRWCTLNYIALQSRSLNDYRHAIRHAASICNRARRLIGDLLPSSRNEFWLSYAHLAHTSDERG